jgi:hypothetical protein
MSLATPEPPRPWWRRLLGQRPDETVLRAVFHALIVLTVVVLGNDLAQRIEAEGRRPPTLLPGETPDVQPFLPSVRREVDTPGDERSGRTPSDELRKPMTIELVAGGRLAMTGAITPGTAERFKAEIDRRGDYVKTVVLNSPGGAVEDALTMARLIREKGFDTEVEAKGLCASSCPLVFAGGVRRIAEKGAAIGVHQVFAVTPTNLVSLPREGDGFAEAQRVSAECQRHLVAMGVDPRVWIHAMETPPERMFYFTPEELVSLKLANGAAPPPAGAAKRT